VQAEEPEPAAGTNVVVLPAGPLTLERLIALAEEHHPDLAIAAARAEAARGRLLQAGLYPNPTVGWEADELGHNGNAAGEQGPLLGQEIVTAGKLRLAQAAAAHGVALADWQAITRRFELLTRVRLAYYEVLTARREVRETEEVLKIAEEGVEVAKKLAAGPTGTKADVLRAEIELSQTRNRLAVAQERADAAWKQLATAVGLPALPPVPLEGDLEQPPPTYTWPAALRTMLTRSSEVQEAQAAIFQAQADLRRAEAEVVPNLHLRVRPFYAFPDEDMRLMVEAEAALPVFNRNQGNIQTARAELARAAAEARQTELRLTDRLTAAFQRYRSAKQQVERYEKEILPKAEDSLRLIRRAAELGAAQFDYTTVLEAQRTLVQARLGYTQALGELWRAVSEIAGLIQEDTGTPPGLGPPLAPE
jgi:cobalt-zinc-cadmium efflux system outer membrane protein